VVKHLVTILHTHTQYIYGYPGSSVSIVTTYTCWTIGRSRFDPRLCTMGAGDPFPEAKARPERDADHSPHLVPRSWMSRSYISSPPKLFEPRVRTHGTHWTGGWVGPRAGLDTGVRGKILSPLPGIEPLSPGSPARSQTLYWLSYPAHCFWSYSLRM
jgi:hypothetical protein